MTEPAAEARAAQDAAESLLAWGRPIAPYGEEMDRWRMGELVMTNDELMALAARHGVCLSVCRIP